MKVTILSRALTASRVPLHVRVADAIRVSTVNLQFKDCRKIALDFGMTEASTGGGPDKGPVINAIGDSPRGHSHSERASHKTHGNRDYRPGPSSSRRPTYEKSRHDCNLCGSRNHRIFNCPSLPMAQRLINKRDHKGNRQQHRTPHCGPGVAHAAAA